MAIQYSVSLRNAQLDAIETVIGTAPLLRIYSGSIPSLPATAASGTLLCTITLPSDWLGAAGSGTKSLSGTWSGTGAAAASTGTNAGYFRILDSGAAATHIQGTITATAGGGDMTLNNISIADGQAVSVSTFAVSAANATS